MTLEEMITLLTQVEFALLDAESALEKAMREVKVARIELQIKVKDENSNRSRR